jgi:hypothetical protein
MTCPACLEAQTAPWTSGSMRGDCQSCQARALARSPAYRDAMIGHPEALQSAMRMLWQTKEAYRAGRLAVYEWARAIEEARSKA